MVSVSPILQLEHVQKDRTCLLNLPTVVVPNGWNPGSVRIREPDNSALALQMSLSINGACLGPLLGLFTLGALVPWANWKVWRIRVFTQMARRQNFDATPYRNGLDRLFVALHWASC